MGIDDLSGRRLGGYELTALLGSGSFGSVWRARQLRLDRDVAVKVLDPLVARDPTAARRFEREGRAAASLDHPAIVPVYEAGDDDGLYYLAMRLVDGDTLADLIDAEAPIAKDRLLELLAPIADALDTAHATGLIHRDVKPANILLENGRPYLTDFGIAASAREMGRYTTGSLGTAEYMAPEQARGDEVDHRADLYALGCVVFHAITGTSPYARDDVVATLVAHSNDPIPPAGSEELDAFFALALAKDPADRYDTGAELIGALGGETPPLPPVPSEQAPAPRPAGRRAPRWALAAAAVVLVVGAVVAGVALTGGDPAEDDAPATTGAADEATGDSPASPTVPAENDPASDQPAATEPSETTSDAAPTVLREGGNVAVGTTLDLDDPNPHANLDAAKVLAEWVLPVMYRIDDNLDPVPSLATGPPVPNPDDPLTLTWTIHGDRVWDDGSPVTAADVAATFAYITAAGTNARNLLLYEPVASVTAVDDVTLRVELTEPHGAAYLMFSTIHPIIEAAVWNDHLANGGAASSFLADGVDFAAGPYRLTSLQNAGEMALSPNPTWTGEESPALDRVDIVSYPDGASLVEAKSLREVEAIWVDDIRRDELLDLEALELDIEGQVAASGIAVQLTFNTLSDPLGDVRIRRAVLHAIDRSAIADIAISPKTGQIAPTWDSLVFAPDQRGNQQPFAGAHDPTEAELLLDEAGWTRPGPGETREREGDPLVLDLALIGESDLTNTAVSIVNDLEAVGVEVRGLSGTVDQTNERMASGQFDLLLQFRLFNSDPVAADQSFGSDGTVNVGGFSDPGIDTSFDVADSTTDPSERLEVFTGIDADLGELVPAIPLYARQAFTAYDIGIIGIEMAPNLGPLVSLGDWAIAAG